MAITLVHLLSIVTPLVSLGLISYWFWQRYEANKPSEPSEPERRSWVWHENVLSHATGADTEFWTPIVSGRGSTVTEVKMGTLTGKRIAGYVLIDDHAFCYWNDVGDGWYFYMPGCGVGCLRNHNVVENPDNTITVTPSIRTTGHNKGQQTEIHGYITDGVWKDA